MSTVEWRKCTTCKNAVGFGVKFYVCNVTTCQGKRAGLIFCSVSCWDAHVPTLRHKEAWAIERVSPTEAAWKEIQAGKREDTTYPEREKPKEDPEMSERERMKKPVAFGNTPQPAILRKRKPE